MGQRLTHNFRSGWLAPLAVLSVVGRIAAADAPEPWRLRFLVEAGAEALPAGPSSSAAETIVTAAVPGSLYLFDRDGAGLPRRRAKLAVDPAAAHDVVVLADSSVVVAGRDGTLARYTPGAPIARWRREVGERVASLAAGSGRVIASTWGNKVVAVSDADGRVLWRTDVGAKSEAPPLVDGDAVYVATKGRSLVALDAARGVVRWRAALPGPVHHAPALSTASVRSVYCGTWDGTLLAHDAASGRLRWSAKVPSRLAGGPHAFGGLVAVATEDGAVRAFEESAGAPRWESAGAALGPATLLTQAGAVRAPRLIVVSRRLAALDPSSGARLAEYPEGAREDLRRRFAQAMIEGEKTYSESEKRAIEEAEAFAIEGSLFGFAHLSPAGIAFGTEDGWLYLFDAATLRPQWRYRSAASSPALPATTSGRVLAAAGSELMAVDAATGAVLWRRDVGTEIESVLAAGDDVAVVAGGRLTFLRTADGTVAARPGGRLKTATPQGSGAAWLTDDGRQVRLLLRESWSEADTLDLGGETLPPVTHGDGWVIATRTGSLAALAADTAAGGTGLRLVRRWSASVGEPVTDLRAAGACLVLRTQAGPLVGVEPATGETRWRRPLAPGAEWSVAGTDVLQYESGELALYDACTGTRQDSRRVEAAPVAGARRGGAFLWLDARGTLHRAAATPGAPPETWDVGLQPSRAVLADGGFIVKTATGETGFLEIPGW